MQSVGTGCSLVFGLLYWRQQQLGFVAAGGGEIWVTSVLAWLVTQERCCGGWPAALLGQMGVVC